MKFKPEDLPECLTAEVIDILVQMAIEFPKLTSDWEDVSKILIERGQLNIILDKVEDKKKEAERMRRSLMSEEEKRVEEEKWKEFLDNADPNKFYGNMGQPETPKEYKDRYGIWPPGYDKDGNRIV